MKTSIIFCISLLLSCSFLAPNGLGQDYVWESYTPPEAPNVNTANDEMHYTLLGKSLLFTRIVNGKPKQFEINPLHQISPCQWNPPFLNEMNIVYPFLHDSTLYFATQAMGNEQAMLSIHELKDGMLKQLDTLNGTCYSSQPFLSPDGNALYFVSDREGGYGGTDIWYFSKDNKNDSWTGPYAMGDTINTRDDETNPFLPHPDTMYFSTNSKENKDFDILVSVRKNGIWSYPDPRPTKGINSKWDETDFMILHDSIAVISRKEKNQTDIHWFKKRNVSSKIPVKLYVTTENITELSQKLKLVKNAVAFRTCIFPSSFKQHDEFMLTVLAERLHKWPTSTITLSNNTLAKTVQSLLLSKRANPKQVIIDSQITDDHIAMWGDKEELFDHFDLIKENICHPSSITITMNSIPEGVISSWKLSVNGDSLTSNSKLPSTYTFETFRHIFNIEDTLSFRIDALDSNGNNVSEISTIGIQSTAENESGVNVISPMPSIWYAKEQHTFVRFIKKYLSTLTSKQHRIELYQTDYNESAMKSILDLLLSDKELSQWEFTSLKLEETSAFAETIKMSLSHAKDHRSFLIPITVK